MTDQGQEREICICAAIRLEGGHVVRGHRHHHCLSAAGPMFPHLNVNRCEQGFITSRNRFVGREEGQALQIGAGIDSVAPGGYRGDILFSEDLY